MTYICFIIIPKYQRWPQDNIFLSPTESILETRYLSAFALLIAIDISHNSNIHQTISNYYLQLLSNLKKKTLLFDLSKLQIIPLVKFIITFQTSPMTTFVEQTSPAKVKTHCSRNINFYFFIFSKINISI